MTRNGVRAVTAILAGALIGCSTPYQGQGFRGGYSDTRIDSNTVLVSFKGNGYTGHEKVETYLLRRCAEVTLADGYDYFVIVDKDDEAVHGSINTAGTYSSSTSATAIGSGNMAFGQSQTTGTFYPGQSVPYVKHRSEVMIKMFKGQKPGDDTRAFDAHELVHYLGTPDENK
jgi:hypothetical protein